ncbi:hypothetical protein JKP88DRAFT_325797 [Tribonema minus]|uniref:Telomere resolvase ResT/TelK catalytic domain-containing protein n=1 Tax=Tribonema minus TaxID=303371 RepID=A0A835Z043_9STRA|nr:hypothetical protein JKP88DRAFT_325797 [Tribonema minus]
MSEAKDLAGVSSNAEESSCSGGQEDDDDDWEAYADEICRKDCLVEDLEAASAGAVGKPTQATLIGDSRDTSRGRQQARARVLAQLRSQRASGAMAWMSVPPAANDRPGAAPMSTSSYLTGKTNASNTDGYAAGVGEDAKAVDDYRKFKALSLKDKVGIQRLLRQEPLTGLEDVDTAIASLPLLPDYVLELHLTRKESDEVARRRMVEIFSAGSFETVEGEGRTLAFSGQVKKRFGSDDTTNFIPTLAPASLMLDAINRLRAEKQSDGLSNRDINLKWSNSCQSAARRLLGDGGHFHELRAMYAVIAYNVTLPHSYSLNAFVSRVLGHAGLGNCLHYTCINVTNVGAAHKFQWVYLQTCGAGVPSPKRKPLREVISKEL